jgi:hypothetical protein
MDLWACTASTSISSPTLDFGNWTSCVRAEIRATSAGVDVLMRSVRLPRMDSAFRLCLSFSVTVGKALGIVFLSIFRGLLASLMKISTLDYHPIPSVSRALIGESTMTNYIYLVIDLAI